MQPPVKFRNGGLAGELPQGHRIPEAGGLIVQHNVVPVGDAHKVVTAGNGEKGSKIFDGVLVGFHMVGVTAVATHGNTRQFAHKMVLQTGSCHLPGIVEILRSNEANHRID